MDTDPNGGSDLFNGSELLVVNNTTFDEVEDENGTQIEKAEVTEFVFEVVLLSAASVFGLIGNVAALVLFSTLKKQLKFHRLMMMLSTFDAFYVVLSFLLFALPQLCKSYTESGAHFFILPKALPLAQIALTGSIYSTLAITLERYLTVCHPFYTVSHKWAAKRYIIPIVSFAFLYNAPKFFELYTYIDPEKVAANASLPYDITASAMRVNKYYITIYCIWMNFAFMGLVPFVLLIVLNSLTLRSLIVQHRPSRNGSTTLMPSASFHANSSTKRNEIALAKVSLTIVFIFIICHSVKWIPNIYELARIQGADKRKWPSFIESTTHVAHFLMTLNSSVNFYVYCVKHFRLCPPCSTEVLDPPASSHSYVVSTLHKYDDFENGVCSGIKRKSTIVVARRPSRNDTELDPL